MRKIIGLLLTVFTVFTVSACTEAEEVHIKVMVPFGSPALAQTYMESEMPSIGENIEYEIDVVNGADPLVAAFGSKSHNIIFAPTNLGAKLISTGIEYTFAGTVTWGNLYIATSSNTPITLDDLDGKEIVAFGQNATPDIILQTILDNHTFTVAPTITYVDNANSAQSALVADNTKIILIAEPLLSVASLPSNVPNIQTIDLQAEWATLTGSSSYPQAGIFVSNELDKDTVDAYLEAIENSVAEALDNPDTVAQMAVDLEYGLPLTVLQGAIGRSNIDFVSALDSKSALEEYFGYIIDFNPALIGGSLPEDTFYYGN